MLREGTAFRLLCAVLHVAALPEEERRLLVRLAALSPGGVEGENLCRWSGCTGRDSLNRLVNLHWAERGEADRVFLTPVIARVAWETAGREAAACLPFLDAWASWYKALPQAERYAWQDTLRAASDHGLTLLRQGAPGAVGKSAARFGPFVRRSEFTAFGGDPVPGGPEAVSGIGPGEPFCVWPGCGRDVQ